MRAPRADRPSRLVKRWLLNVIAATSLLLSLAAAVGWAMSHVQPLEWRLIWVVHSAGLARIGLDRANVIFMVSADGPGLPRHAYLDAMWVQSRSGTLSLVAQAADFTREASTVSASPWSLAVDLRDATRAQAVTSDRISHTGGWPRRLGFAWDSDVQQAIDHGDGTGGSTTVQVRMLTVPWWFVFLLGVPLPLLWMRAKRRQRRWSESGL